MPPDPSRLRRYARAMRHDPVSTETMLWDIFRDRRLEGLKFRRQVPIGNYIADFLCYEHRLIVEADGPTHEDSVHDVKRDAWLRSEGFRVLRFSNFVVGARTDLVVTAILKATGKL